MEQSLDKRPELKDAIQSFFNNNKKKIFLFISIVIAITVVFFLWEDNNHKKNILISEKYTKAQLLLSKNEKKAATKHFEEIILSKNKFYSVLALNMIVEKDLITDKEQILNFFEILKNLNLSKDKLDLIKLKKALYLAKISNFKESEALLKDLEETNSSLNLVIDEILSKK